MLPEQVTLFRNEKVFQVLVRGQPKTIIHNGDLLEFELHVIDEHIFCRGVQLQPCMPCSSVHCALRSSGHAGPRGSKWSLRWMGRWL
jgi:hypothetical protein